MNPIASNLRRQFTISCTEESGVIIEDGNGKKGGNVRAHKGKKLSWQNATNESVCYLKFTVLPDADEAGAGAQGWPFSVSYPPPTPDQLLEVSKGQWATGTLKLVTDWESYEYVVLGADKTELVDPIIIIDPN